MDNGPLDNEEVIGGKSSLALIAALAYKFIQDRYVIGTVPQNIARLYLPLSDFEALGTKVSCHVAASGE